MTSFITNVWLIELSMYGKFPEFFRKNSGKFPTFYFSGKLTTLVTWRWWFVVIYTVSQKTPTLHRLFLLTLPNFDRVLPRNAPCICAVLLQWVVSMSVRPSLCSSVCNVEVPWSCTSCVTSKINSRIISLGSSLLGVPTSARGIPQNVYGSHLYVRSAGSLYHRYFYVYLWFISSSQVNLFQRTEAYCHRPNVQYN